MKERFEVSGEVTGETGETMTCLQAVKHDGQEVVVVTPCNFVLGKDLTDRIGRRGHLVEGASLGFVVQHYVIWGVYTRREN